MREAEERREKETRVISREYRARRGCVFKLAPKSFGVIDTRAGGTGLNLEGGAKSLGKLGVLNCTGDGTVTRTVGDRIGKVEESWRKYEAVIIYRTSFQPFCLNFLRFLYGKFLLRSNSSDSRYRSWNERHPCLTLIPLSVTNLHVALTNSETDG